MIQSKNFKLKLGLCGLALTSFLAINAHSTVHADTVNGDDVNAITWDSDQDDSQVVKEEPQQQTAPQSVQTRGAVQSAPATQSVQSNNQKRTDKSAVRVSNFNTSTVNRNNAQNARNNANVKVATVHDTAQIPVQKQKVAQFNQGSKIYTLNGSNQLSKNNGDGYVITNAGKYNGRVVDIGVTINNVQDNQGSYTTKWSNGDKADVTGKVDNEFNYQNGVTVNSQVVQPIVPSQTRSRTEDQQVSTKVPDYWWHFRYNNNIEGSEADVFFDPVLVTQISSVWDVNQNDVLHELVSEYSSDFSLENNWQQYLKNVDFNQVSAITPLDHDNVFHEDSEYEFTENDGSFTGALTRVHYNSSIAKGYTPKYSENHPYVLSALGGVSPNGYYIVKSEYNNNDEALNALLSRKKYKPTWNDVLYSGLVSVNSYPITQCDNEAFANFSNSDKHVIMTKPVNVTDHLRVDQVNNGSLNYNYTVGLYDAQTGDLITDLRAEYKGKTGVQATSSSFVMNNAIKNKIQQINQNKATVSYTGTSANDDVAFYQETRQVNPQSTDVNRKAQRVIHVTFPNGVKPASYDGIVDANNDIVQTVTFTRTGTENIVSGQKTYGQWQQHGGFSAVTLPSIPGYTMTTTGV